MEKCQNVGTKSAFTPKINNKDYFILFYFIVKTKNKSRKRHTRLAHYFPFRCLSILSHIQDDYIVPYSSSTRAILH